MIKELYLKNFRGIKEGKLEDFSRFNILMGPNNSGKSTILESLYLLFSTAPAEILISTYPAKTEEERKEMEGKFFPCLIPQRDFLGYEDPLLRLRKKHNILEWIENRGKFSEGYITVGNVGTKEAYWQIQHPDGFKKGDEEKIGYIALDYTKEGLLSDKQKTEKKWLSLAMPEKETEPVFFDDGRVGVLWFQKFIYENADNAILMARVSQKDLPPDVLFFDESVAMGYMQSSFYERISSSVPGWRDKITERFGRIFPNGDFQINLSHVRIDPTLTEGSLAYKGKIPISVDLLGDGARSIFKFVAYLTALGENGLVLWEDPELFQHTETLERSLREIVDIVKDKKAQIFLCTQSLEVLGIFAEMINKGTLSSDDVRAYYMELKEGKLRYRPFTGENLLEWIKMRLDLRKKHELNSKLIYQMGEKE